MNTIKKTRINSLYIHIPFCDSICPYCDFTKFISKDIFKSKYVDEILKDLKKLFNSGYRFKTIYIGGGTPTCLSYNDLKRLLEKAKLLLNKNYEFTIEANPESIDEYKLRLFKSVGINRISIGIQSFSNKILQIINRDYGIDYYQLINLVKKYINNINLDLIYGLPTQTIDDIKNDLKKIIQLNVNHISTYSLSINPSSLFYIKKVKEISSDESRLFYDVILNELRKNGYNRYEVSNFAKPGYESKHNITYWKDEQYFGIGCGASGYIYPTRYKISSSLTDFLKGKRNYEKDVVDTRSDLEYFLICNLRLEKGFSLTDFKKHFKFDFLSKYKDKIDKFIKNGTLINKDERIYCSDEGLITLDQILINII